MKKNILTILILAFLAIPAYGALTNSVDVDAGQITSYWWTGEPLMDVAWLWSKEVEDILEGTTALTSIYFDPTDTAPTASEGMLYYHETDEALKLRTSSAWVDIDVSGASSLGSAYAIGSAITVDTDAITLTSTDSANNVILALVHGETGNFSALTITNASAYPGIQITGSSTGADITGTSATWSVATTGVATLVGATIGNSDLTFTEPSSNNVYLLADADSQLTIGGTSKEDINLNFHTADTLTISSSTGMDKVAWGGVDEHSGLLSLTFDPAVAGLITIAGTGNTDDISITQTGTTDVSVALVSAGSVSDAIHIESSDSVGGILIDSGDILDIDSVDDITIDTTDGTYTLTIAGGTDGDYIMTAADTMSVVVVDTIGISNTEAGKDITIDSTAGSVVIDGGQAVADAVTIKATGVAGGIDITSLGDIDITTTGAATEDISITNTGGSIIVTATENVQNGIHIETNGGTSESINLYANQGTGASATTEHDASIQLHSDDGGISLYTTGDVANAISLETNSGTSETITVGNLQGTGAGAIALQATAGGITAKVCDEKELKIGNAGLDAYFIVAASATAGNEDVRIVNTNGTANASIELTSTAGGILAKVCDEKTLTLGNAASDAYFIVAASATAGNEDVRVVNTNGTDAAAIDLEATAGGITLTCVAGTSVVFTAGQTKSVIFTVTDVELDPTLPPGTTSIGTSEQAAFDTLGFDADGTGTDDYVFINWVVPAGYVADSGDLHVYWSYSDAEDAADDIEIDGTVNAVAPGEAIDGAGTVMTAVAATMTGNTDNDLLIKTSLDIEVEDIVIGDLVCIMFFVDNSACELASSGTADVHYFEITYESTE